MALHVGLSGGIGSGKSTVSKLLVERGAVLVDSDVIAREVVAPGTQGLALVRERFGDGVVDDDGALDRPALAATVFGDDAARADLNAIVHPLVAQEAIRQVQAAPDDAIVVQDIPLLVELGREVDYQLTVIVAADPDVRLERLVRTRGMSEADARARMDAQATGEQRRAAADVWLENGSTQADLADHVERLWTQRLVPFEHNLRTRTAVRRPATAALAEPDPGWAPTARRLLGRLDRALQRASLRDRVHGLEHIGSTAVPGLAAKDVINLQLTLDDLTLATTDAFESAVLTAGFVQPRERLDTVHAWAPDESEWRKVLYGNADPGRVVHLHVRRAGSPGAEVAVAFRDWLRAEPQAREAYAALKQRAVADHPGGDERTRADYTAAKEPWFAEHLPQALEWSRQRDRDR